MKLKLTPYLAHDLGHVIPKAIDAAGLSAEVSAVTNGGTGTGTAILVLEASKETNYQAIRVIVEVTTKQVHLFARLVTQLKDDILAKCKEDLLAGREITETPVQVAEVTAKLQGRCEPAQVMTMVLKLQIFDPNQLTAAASLIRSGLFQLDSHYVDVKADLAKDEIRVSGMAHPDNLEFIQETFSKMTVEFQPVGDDGPEPAVKTSGDLEILREAFETQLNTIVTIDEYIVVNARFVDRSVGGDYFHLELGVSDEVTVEEIQALVAKINQLFAYGKVLS
jgi:hypothetical protein